ncbi:DEAD/DEAH box helicase [Aequorivita sp. KMM 9714]|uniref:DEAD/DEAH box helicase n=1 Tax=Aequorivita sp. KMM 9714 TaxID=2707173 RepID=UPI0013EB4A4A|nr:DEAD/DEAH box helicase [Aequorivita sp. KMM 9714]NGX83572.1 DEAD/DEAH box helicase [Aequorivita sp. KMM 9714]
MTFKSLGLSDALLKAISKKGYETPSAIQQKAIPLILERKDVLASAQTGSGKTAGFALPLLQILQNQPILHKRPVRALILTPTRELAAQVQQEFKDYSEFTDLRSTVIFGGVGANPQINALRNGVDVLVATPGRLLDLHNQRAVSLSKVEVLVLDEADRMLDMGFARDIKKILALLPSKRQNLLFSATFSKEIKKLANEFLHQPVLVEATPENTTVEKIDQTVYRVDKNLKTDLIIKLISEGNWQQVLVFTRTKHGANRLSEKLEKAKITSAAIHGNKSQGARTRALAGFKEGKVRVLVATDIAARGLDIPLLPHVINYELPNVSEDYVHRIGRTGRAGASGEALSLVSLDEVGYLKDIEKLIGERLQAKILTDFEPTETMADVKEAEAEKKRQKAAHHSRGRNTGRGKAPSKGKSTRSSNRR